MDYIRAIERQQIREDIPQVRVADNVKVHYRIKEGDRERIQVFQGDVIRMGDLLSASRGCEQPPCAIPFSSRGAVQREALRRSQRLSTRLDARVTFGWPFFLSDLHARRAWYGQHDELGFGIAGCR